MDNKKIAKMNALLSRAEEIRLVASGIKSRNFDKLRCVYTYSKGSEETFQLSIYEPGMPVVPVYNFRIESPVNKNFEAAMRGVTKAMTALREYEQTK